MLECKNVKTDQLITQYTWPDTAGGQPSGKYLIFDKVTRAQHRLPVRCMASYDPSVSIEPSLSETVALQVYYRPVINITWDDSSCEELKSSPNRFAVTQGRNVTFLCRADSNPPVRFISWYSYGGIYSNNGTLDISLVNRSMRGSGFTCRVEIRRYPDERRLRIADYHSIYIIIKYPPAVQTFQLNAVDHPSVTVAENSFVQLLCKADGRPTPRVLLTRSHGIRILSSRPQGDIVEEEMGELIYKITLIKCEDSDDYRCEVDNGEGRDRKTISLFVLCAPRRDMSDEDPPYLDVRDNKGHVSLTMTAYPAPSVSKKTYCGTSLKASGENETAEDRIDVSCTATPTAPALVTCNVNVVNVSMFAEGLYKIVFRNSLGELPYIFRLKHDDSGITGKISSQAAAITVGTITGLITAVAIVTFVVLFWRRQALNSAPDLRYVDYSPAIRKQSKPDTGLSRCGLTDAGDLRS